jgi:hypothetical protein
MSASSSTLLLPAATAKTIDITIPTVGSWLGGVVVSFVSAQNATISLTAIKFPQNTNLGSRTVLSGYSLLADKRRHETLRRNESILKLTYTATAELSVTIETDRLYLPAYINF